MADTSNHTSIQLPLPLDEDTDIIIPLTKGYSTVVSYEDRELVQHSWSASIGANNDVRCRGWINKHKVVLHRVIMERVVKRPLACNEVVDHISGDVLDNRRANLRLTDCHGNVCNAKRRSDNKSGFKGVTKVRNRWRATIMINKQWKHLGYFDTAEEAHEAWWSAAQYYFGEFARKD